MTITLNHTIVPARDKIAGAKFFARLFGLKRDRADHFAPVKVNKSLTLLFDSDDKFESHHLAFHVNSTPSCAASGERKSLTVARHGASKTASSTTGTAAAASISAIRTDTCSN